MYSTNAVFEFHAICKAEQSWWNCIKNSPININLFYTDNRLSSRIYWRKCN